MNSNRFLAAHRDAVAEARLGEVIPQRIVLGAAVVPEGDRVRLPAEAALEQRVLQVLVEIAQDAGTLVVGDADDMAREEAVKKVDQTEVIASLIDEELIVQKGKEIGVDEQAEAEINQRLVGIMKEQKLKTLDALYEEMRKGGLNPEDIKSGMRRQYIQSTVLQSEVDRKIYYGISAKEMKDYYEKKN